MGIKVNFDARRLHDRILNRVDKLYTEAVAKVRCPVHNTTAEFKRVGEIAEMHWSADNLCCNELKVAVEAAIAQVNRDNPA